MPAYRSSAEAEIREAVVAHLREIMPECRIIHEINVESFGNRIDVLAVGDDRLAAVEIKSAKDKLDRLPAQIKAMQRVTPHVYAALHEKFLTTSHGNIYPPTDARGAIVWAFPRIARPGHVECGVEWRARDQWRRQRQVMCLPAEALNILWRDELHAICGGLGVKGVSKLTMSEAIDHIRWRMTGEQITKTVCRSLKARDCIEADPVVLAAA